VNSSPPRREIALANSDPDRVARAHALDEPRRHLAQEVVAERVAERVVDALEVVEVEEQHAEHQPASLRVLDRRAQPVGEHAPVAEAGQRVVVREEPDLFLGAPPLGDVLRGALEFARLSVGADRHLRLAVDHSLDSVGQQDPEVGRERAAGAHRLRDRLRDRAPVVGMHAPEQLGRVDRLVGFVELVQRAQLA
jgi:hypothetical protein